MSKKTIAITGGDGFLGSNFYKKFKNKYRIIKYPYRIQNSKKFSSWVKENNFEIFIHFAALTRHSNKDFKKKINNINVKSSLKIMQNIEKLKSNKFTFFLFISSCHVYGYSNDKIKESKSRIPQNIMVSRKSRSRIL